MKNVKNIVNNVMAKNNCSTVQIEKTNFAIVGIGASAGGLEALLAFLRNVPKNSGLAFVIVQHMEQLRKSELAELLQGATNMKVIQVTENISVKPNCVYVIPPNKNMSIRNKVLHLFTYAEPHTLRSPIDYFFKSLGEDEQCWSVGVVLSGMGTDGTSGLREIKENGGAVFIQEPSTAKFGDMPNSVIEAGLADVVADVEAIPQKIISYLENRPRLNRNCDEQPDKLMSYIETIIQLLQSKTGNDFSSYKINTIHRRIERRMSILEIDKIESYISFLQENLQELNLLFKEFLIGVTSFFREPLEWEMLKDKVLPALLSERSPNDTIRAWVSGCSTGQEAYTLAMVFSDVLEQLEYSQDFSVQIFATDLDLEAINKAREGVFPFGIKEEMSNHCLNRYFIKVDRGYQVVKSLRDKIIFAQQNMIKDPPFTKIDIIVCRNLLIYLNTEMQKKLIPLFHYSLNPGGILFLGSAETVGGFTNLFNTFDRKSRIYQRLQPLIQEEQVEFPTTFSAVKPRIHPPAVTAKSIQLLADKLILQNYSPATVLVNKKGDIIYITGRTGGYLEPAAGNANWNIFAMAREGLGYYLSDAFYKTLKQNKEVVLNNLEVINESGTRLVDISVKPISEPEELRDMIMIIFNDAVTTNVMETTSKTAEVSLSSQRASELELELMQARKFWQITSMEMQLIKEEYKSSNEELQSTNEELQSTNEELTTTKEEVQSLNEQLKKMNFELQDKFDDLLLISDDMKNQMDSIKIAALFLDNKMCIKQFTNQMCEVSRLIFSDVGRPITDITSELVYTEFTEDINKVINTSVTVEKQIMSLNGDWFKIRILPYHTLEGIKDGVIITYENITESKGVESKLYKTIENLKQRIVELGGDPEKESQSEVAAGRASESVEP